MDSIIEKYDLLIDRLAKFIKTIGICDSLELSYLLSYIINNGYLSDNKTFTKGEILNEIPYKLGTSIIRGTGCCRNFSAIHKDLFDRLEVYDKYLYCYQGFGKGLNREANHVINLIYYANNYYGIDIYNYNKLYKFKNEYLLKEISLPTKSKLVHKPYYELGIKETKLNELLDFINMLKEASLNKYINDYEYDIIRYEIINKIKQNKDSYEDFYLENQQLINTINNEMDNVLGGKNEREKSHRLLPTL